MQSELYRQMGKYFYDYFAVAAEGKMKEWCDGVKASQQQVQVYKEQIQTLKGTVSCPNCGAEVSSGSAFCNVCGTKIEHKVPNLPGMWCFCSGTCSVLYFLWN